MQHVSLLARAVARMRAFGAGVFSSSYAQWRLRDCIPSRADCEQAREQVVAGGRSGRLLARSTRTDPARNRRRCLYGTRPRIGRPPSSRVQLYLSISPVTMSGASGTVERPLRPRPILAVQLHLGGDLAVQPWDQGVLQRGDALRHVGILRDTAHLKRQGLLPSSSSTTPRLMTV